MSEAIERFQIRVDDSVHEESAGHQPDDVLGDDTHTITSSARLTGRPSTADLWKAAPEFVGVPTGIARSLKEVLRFPRSWFERHYNVTHWTVMPRSGHLAAMEQPALFVEDLRNFFRAVR